jgi:hypothetical protein
MSLNIADLDSTVSEGEEGLFEERGEGSGWEGIVSTELFSVATNELAEGESPSMKT